MSNINVPRFITKGLEIAKDSDERIFTGHITAEVVDIQNEFIAVDEVMKKMDNYMNVNPVMSEGHTNRIVGEVLKYEESEIEGHPSVKVKSKIYKQDGVTLYDKVWEGIKKGEYTGLSLGGGSNERVPIIKDDKMAISLKDLEIYEVAICKEPANPLAIIDNVNEFAKSHGIENKIKDNDGKSMIQCDSVQCWVSKQYEPFQKPVRGHSWNYWQNKLKEENPEYTDEQVNSIIGSWEQEEKDSKKSAYIIRKESFDNIDPSVRDLVIKELQKTEGDKREPEEYLKAVSTQLDENNFPVEGYSYPKNKQESDAKREYDSTQARQYMGKAGENAYHQYNQNYWTRGMNVLGYKSQLEKVMEKVKDNSKKVFKSENEKRLESLIQNN